MTREYLRFGALAAGLLVIVACGGRTPFFNDIGDVICGDGVREGGEACDGLDLDGQSCSDQLSGSNGLLACTQSCQFNLSGCEMPARCGDGVLNFGEQCDCGNDPVAVPSGCNFVNGHPLSECDDSCRMPQQCFGELWDQCNINDTPDPCCGDDWGADTDCTWLGNDAYCMRGCQTSQDCYWSNFCYADAGNHCYFSLCGEGLPTETMNTPCQGSAGAGPGWCAPFWGRSDPGEDYWGLCVEAGDLQPGASCSLASDLTTTDRSVPVCDMGFCYDNGTGGTNGRCVQFCDWEAAYSVAIYTQGNETLPCPTGTNCISTAAIDSTTGIRGGDLGFCMPRPSAGNPGAGVDTCSLVNSKLLAQPTQTCAQAGYSNGVCYMVDAAPDPYNGSLVGVCGDAAGAPNRTVWQTCNPSNDRCPTGTRCRPEDLFQNNTDGPNRCLPLCDTKVHNSGSLGQSCASLGAPPNAVCSSLSELFGPSGPFDVHPTRLGFCALPQ